MTPEQREELKKVAQNAVDTQIGGWPFHGQVFKRLTTPGAILSLIAQVEALTLRAERAERALVRGGFVDHGGQEWKPPLGPAPKFIEVEALTVPQDEPTAEQYDEMLRALCCQYGVGGYNSDGLIDPKVAESKLRFALDEQFRVGGELSFNRTRGELRDAAAAVVARWDSLDWTLPHTADFIDRLRIALAAPTIPAIPGTKEGA